jgi:hypothetical protein
MAKQLNIIFNQPAFDMQALKLAMLQAELTKCELQIEKYKKTISTYKGHFTKQKIKNTKYPSR